ncbi:MAG: CobD/CbiB family cobalamin biosynthesis protein, partial [Marmoricola sp.]
MPDDHRARAAGLALGYLLDVMVGDPRRGHPVAGFGRLAQWLEHRWYADARPAGTAYVVVLVGAAAATGAGLDRAARTRPGLIVLVTAAATWTALGARTLLAEAAGVHAPLAAGKLDRARDRVTHLVGRDPTTLGADGLARATVESVAENTSDAVVAPLLWGAVAGPAGLLGYRALNTLDAMVGHRTPRHARFGWCAARLDDLANLLPARATALAVAAAGPFVTGDRA